MSTQFAMTQSCLNQLERLTTSEDILRRLKNARETRAASSKMGAPSHTLTLSEDQRVRLAASVAAAMNEQVYDGGGLTACGHVYEGLLAMLRAPEMADA